MKKPLMMRNAVVVSSSNYSDLSLLIGASARLYRDDVTVVYVRYGSSKPQIEKELQNELHILGANILACRIIGVTNHSLRETLMKEGFQIDTYLGKNPEYIDYNKQQRENDILQNGIVNVSYRSVCRRCECLISENQWRIKTKDLDNPDNIFQRQNAEIVIAPDRKSVQIFQTDQTCHCCG